MSSALPLSANTTRVLLQQTIAELHTQEQDAKNGIWDKHREKRIIDLCALFKQRCDIRDSDNKPLGYTDPMDPNAEVGVFFIREAVSDVWALKDGCAQ